MMTDAEITALIEEIATLKKQVSDKDDVIAKLNDELTRLLNKVLGHTSEKHLPFDPAQLLLFDQKEMSESERAALEANVKKADDTITYTVNRKAKPSLKPLDDNKLEVVETHIYPDSTCDETGKIKPEHVEIGTEETRTLERVTARVFINSTVRHKVILKSDIEDKQPEDRKILIADLPLLPVPRCLAGASVLTDIVIGKFMYHLPFYRQIQQYKEAGITISDSTMGDRYEAAVERLKLLYDLLRKQILQSEYIHVDESTYRS